MYPRPAWGVLSRSWWPQKNDVLPSLTDAFQTGDAQHPCKQFTSGRWNLVTCNTKFLPTQASARRQCLHSMWACPATTASAMAMELSWEKIIDHSDLLWRQQYGVLQCYRDFALPHCIKAKFCTAFAAKWLSFPQSQILCILPALHSLSTSINWSR